MQVFRRRRKARTAEGRWVFNLAPGKKFMSRTYGPVELRHLRDRKEQQRKREQFRESGCVEKSNADRITSIGANRKASPIPKEIPNIMERVEERIAKAGIVELRKMSKGLDIKGAYRMPAVDLRRALLDRLVHS